MIGGMKRSLRTPVRRMTVARFERLTEKMLLRDDKILPGFRCRVARFFQ
jgi:hypothetical protein